MKKFLASLSIIFFFSSSAFGSNYPTTSDPSTGTKQDTGNSSLSSIDGKTPALGQALAASSVPVVLTAAQITTLTPVSTVTANAGTNLNTSSLLTTTAHDAAFGTAGSADAQVRTIQGVASMTPVQVSQATASNLNATVTDGAGALNVIVDSSGLPSGASTLAEQQTQTTALQLLDNPVSVLGTATYTEATSSGFTIGAVRRDADTTLVNTTNEIAPLQVDANGYLKVEAFSGQTLPVSLASAQVASGAIASGAIASGAIASGAVASGAIASGAIAAGAIAAGATSIADNEDVASAGADRLIKVAQIRLDTPVSGANLTGSGDYTQFIADSFGKTWTAGTYAEDLAHIDLEALSGGGQRRIDTAATSAGASGDWATENQSAEGASWATLTPTTTSGLSVANMTSGDTFTALTATAQVIKATTGNLYGYYIYNPNTSVAYVNLYNIAAASVTVGTSTPLLNFAIPASSGANLMFPYPITFSNAGWSASATTTGGGNTAPTTALEAMFWYK